MTCMNCKLNFMLAEEYRDFREFVIDNHTWVWDEWQKKKPDEDIYCQECGLQVVLGEHCAKCGKLCTV